jgi:hypothetical protein
MTPSEDWHYGSRVITAPAQQTSNKRSNVPAQVGQDTRPAAVVSPAENVQVKLNDIKRRIISKAERSWLVWSTRLLLLMPFSGRSD